MKLPFKVATIATALLLSTSLFAETAVHTEQCELELNNTLTIMPDHILIKDDEETLIDIYQDKMVFVSGELVELDAEQQVWVQDYATTLRDAIPRLGEIAVEAVDVAYEGVMAAFDMDDENEKIAAKFADIKQKIKQKYQDTNNGYYTFADGELSQSVDGNGIDQAVEELMEDLMPVMIGSLISKIGDSISSGDDSFADLENLADDVERQIEGKADAIGKKAEQFCLDLKRADDIENQLIASNLKFIDFDLLSINLNRQH